MKNNEKDTMPQTKSIVFFLLLFFISFNVKAQSADSIYHPERQDTTSTTIISPFAQDSVVVAIEDSIAQAKDTVVVVSKTASSTPDWAPNPHRATLWALIPGGGQIYNWHHHDKWWAATLKLAAIYGGAGTLTYFIIRNTNDFRDFQNAYKWVSTEGKNGHENQYTDGSYSADQLKSYADYYQTNMEWCYLFTALLYGLQIVEATVTAHLLTFDVSDNLSLGVKPMLVPTPSSTALPNTFGLALRYKVSYK